MNAPDAISMQSVHGFRRTLDGAICAMDCEAMNGEAGVSARFDGVALGDSAIYRYTGRPLHACSRKHEHIRADHVDDFLFAMPREIPAVIRRAGRDVLLAPNHFMMLSTREPFDVLYGIEAGGIQVGDILRVSGALLRKHVPNLNECCGVSVAGNIGAGAVMFSMVDSLVQQGQSLSGIASRMFGVGIANTAAIAMLSAPELSLALGSRREVAHARTRTEAQAFIECNIANPLLDAAMVAGHCHVSMRNLYSAFEPASMTVGSLIRELRLLRCRDDIVNPAFRNQPIAVIASKWGCGNLASFTRAYRERFGSSPGEERRNTATLFSKSST